MIADNNDGRQLAQAFDELLIKYRRADGGDDNSNIAFEFDTLIAAFSRHLKSTTKVEKRIDDDRTQLFSYMLRSFHDAKEEGRKKRESDAPDFNLLEVLRLTGNEIRHSMMLAWLLDRDVYGVGTHGQGNLGLRCFLSELSLPPHYAECDYWVRREVPGTESIVDIEIGAHGGFLIHVENKIWSPEGGDQTVREWNDILRRAPAIGLSPEKNRSQIHAIYLSVAGEPPISEQFRSVTWGQMARVVKSFAGAAKAREVQLFAEHYARAILNFVAMERSSVRTVK